MGDVHARSWIVAVAMLGSLTVLPALLSRLGDRVDRLHVPLVGRLRRDSGEGRFWGAVVDRVLRRPLLSAALAGGLLLALALPALQLRTAEQSPATYPAHRTPGVCGPLATMSLPSSAGSA